MAKAYVITSSLLVNGKPAGETVLRDELTDPDFLEAIGYITPVSASSTKKSVKGGDGLVESTSGSDEDPTPTDSQQETR